MHRSLSSAQRSAILTRVQTLHVLLTLLFASLTIGCVAWHWHQPKSYALGIAYSQSVPVLLVASLLVNSISYYFQQRYVRNLLGRSSIVSEFRIVPFALRFYFYNLATAIGLSVLGFMPLFLLLFFYWIYPIALWLVPYHALIGMLLGWDIKRGLQQP